MKIKTSELQGQALEYATAKAAGYTPLIRNGNVYIGPMSVACFSSDWSKAGPIVEREKISLTPDVAFDRWQGFENVNFTCMYGKTPLIAAMRCYVASKLGDSVEIPSELCS